MFTIGDALVLVALLLIATGRWRFGGFGIPLLFEFLLLLLCIYALVRVCQTIAGAFRR